jgi:hypothetical protein
MQLQVSTPLKTKATLSTVGGGAPAARIGFALLRLGWMGKNESIYIGPPPHPSGTHHANSVFTADDIRAIRKERAKGRTLVALSIKYGVHTDTIQKICLRKSYKQVE